MNETIRKFGYPATLVREYPHWVVLLRQAQPTLGSLILAARSPATAFGELEPAFFAELQTAIRDIEASLAGRIGHDKINYLMLMMVDPHVHFHVIPRYAGARSACGIEVADAGWPKAPALGEARALTAAEIAALTEWLRPAWPSAPA
jgi:diadenosine tetraphosphate (Ap4A) HIT family hydrolase